MEDTGPILALFASALAIAYLGYRVSKERERLRETVGILGEADRGLIESLENLVIGEKLTPASPGHWT